MYNLYISGSISSPPFAFNASRAAMLPGSSAALQGSSSTADSCDAEIQRCEMWQQSWDRNIIIGLLGLGVHFGFLGFYSKRPLVVLKSGIEIFSET